MNTKVENAAKILKEYAVEGLLPIRSTSDISPLEEWLLLRLLDNGYIPKDIDYPEEPDIKEIQNEEF